MVALLPPTRHVPSAEREGLDLLGTALRYRSAWSLPGDGTLRLHARAVLPEKRPPGDQGRNPVVHAKPRDDVRDHRGRRADGAALPASGEALVLQGRGEVSPEEGAAARAPPPPGPPP